MPAVADELPQPEDRYVEGEPRLHYLQWDAAGAPAVLLLHGSTQHARVWEGVASGLEGYAVTALDLRGHGGSARDGAYGPEEYVRDVERAVQAIGRERVALVGHSMGSLVAMRYAAEHPRRVWAAVFMDIDAHVPEYQVETLHGAGARPGATFESREAALGRVARQHPDVADEVRERLFRASFLADGGGRYAECYDRATLAQFARWDNSALLAGIPCPTLVMRGGASEVHSPEAAREMTAALPDGRFHEVPGADHMLHIKRAGAVTAALLDFLRPAGKRA